MSHKKTTSGPIIILAILCVCIVVLAVFLFFTIIQNPAKSHPASHVEDFSNSTELSTGGLPKEPELSRAEKLLRTMTLEEKIYQLFIVCPEQLAGEYSVTETTPAATQAILTHPVGGIIYFGQNILTPEQCTDMISQIQAASKLPLFIAVDEEGGMVARIGSNPGMGTTDFPNMGRIQTTQEAYQVGNTIGREIRQFGFNLDFAPVADVNSNPDNPVIGQRSFGQDAAQVAELVQAAVAGFQDSHMLCTLKHFPGHGDTASDSHYSYVETKKTLSELNALEFLPFIAGIRANVDLIMVGHISAPNITGNDLPATLSAEMIIILREELGFQGLIITDSMQMGAITDNYTSAEAAVLAIEAGVDILLMPENLEEAMQGIQEAIAGGRLTEERIDASVLRILQKKLDAGMIPR